MKFDNILNATHRRDSFLVAKEMIIYGSFRSDTPGQVAGIVNGDITCKGRMPIAKEGIINGDIVAEELLVYGKINGNVKTCNKITVQSGAVIKGNVNTLEIHIEKEALIEGLITKSGSQVVLDKKTELARKSEISEHNEPVHDQPGTERQKWF